MRFFLQVKLEKLAKYDVEYKENLFLITNDNDELDSVYASRNGVEKQFDRNDILIISEDEASTKDSYDSEAFCELTDFCW